MDTVITQLSDSLCKFMSEQKQSQLFGHIFPAIQITGWPVVVSSENFQEVLWAITMKNASFPHSLRAQHLKSLPVWYPSFSPSRSRKSPLGRRCLLRS